MNKTASAAFLSLAIVFGLPKAAPAHPAHHHHPAAGTIAAPESTPTPSGESLFNVEGKWTTQDGREVALSSLAGHPTLVAMLYTSCTEACPMTVTDLKRIEAALPEAARSQVRVALFSFDSKRDTPSKLAEFMKSRSLDPARWTAYHGSPTSVRKLAAVLGIRYQRDEKGDFDHSNVISVIDPGGVVRHQQVGLQRDPKETAAKVAELEKPAGS